MGPWINHIGDIMKDLEEVIVGFRTMNEIFLGRGVKVVKI